MYEKAEETMEIYAIAIIIIDLAAEELGYSFSK
jgi:hypothetical protein